MSTPEWNRQNYAANTEKVLARTRAYQAANRGYYRAKNKEHHDTVRGRLLATYKSMRRRVEGGLPKVAHIYKGLSLLDKDAFLAWAETNEQFLRLFAAWKQAGKPRALTPSIDRIKNEVGYELGNLQWLTLQDNSRKARGTL